jgi:hypothetical protein
MTKTGPFTMTIHLYQKWHNRNSPKTKFTLYYLLSMVKVAFEKRCLILAEALHSNDV